MRSSWLCVATLIVFSIVLSVSAQNQAQKQQTTPSTSADEFEKAHQNLFGPPTDKAAEASRLTTGFAAAGPAVLGDIQRKNYIDEQIFGRMERDGIPHAPLASDQEFVRRVYLDATGLLPTPGVVREFIASQDPNKRDRLIDSFIDATASTDLYALSLLDAFPMTTM